MKALAITGLLAALALAGCTDNAIEYEVPPMEDGKYVIEMTESFKFTPKNAEVPVGATVLWRNAGGVHNVRADDGAWQHGPVTEADFELVITEEMLGEHYYFCDPHESLGMWGYLNVVPADNMDTMAA